MSQQSPRGYASVGLRVKATQDVASGTSRALTSEELPPYNKGHTTAKAARWILSEVEVGYRKKGVVKEPGILSPPCRASAPVRASLRWHRGRGESYDFVSAKNKGLAETG
ncbi:hypothetical protein BREVNS_1691 [Brevinematales bacterium NS]|nr:hypothetical protein BREVNS_1691 [Brevinematales bacterium NS]